jgi:hypothetical protein
LRAIAAALLLACTLAVAASAQESKLLPVDEGARDVSWLRFKKRLSDAIDKRDKAFLLSILDRNVRNQSEKTRGIAEFRKQWELDTADTPIWHELATALQLGAAYLKRDNRAELCAPYLLAKWPPDVEPFTHGAIIARDSTVQAEPSLSSSALGHLSYDIVPVSDWEVADKSPNARQKWVRIRFGERDGYVLEEHVRSPVEQAACFVKTPGGWRMTAFAPAGGE